LAAVNLEQCGTGQQLGENGKSIFGIGSVVFLLDAVFE
jgi:hypothetical protein